MKFSTVIVMAALFCTLSVFGYGEWYKGALHLHSLWSDGDAAPELAASWYKEHGWNFICFTDHNTLLEGEVFKPIADDSSLTESRVQELRSRFGEDWVQTEERLGRLRMRLKTFEELAKHFNEANLFLLMHGEEITSFGGNPHVGAVNVRERTGGVQKGDVSALIGKYIHAVLDQETRFNHPMLHVLNHVNWSDGVTVEEALAVESLRYFEVFNGHPGVNNWGHETHGYPPTDRFWDLLLAFRIAKEPEFMLYGLGTDDAHNYFEFGPKQANPGRGWVMVQAQELSPSAIIEAMKAGNFYASTGVMLDDIQRDGAGLSFKIQAEPDIVYTTRFYGTCRDFEESSQSIAADSEAAPPRASRVYSEEIGIVLSETTDLSPRYEFNGKELYVRAKVVSNKPHPNPFRPGDTEMAWVQPAVAK